MRPMRLAMLGAAALIHLPAASAAAPVPAPTPAPEPTGVYIRRLAGLPADSAKGEIEIVDVGHDPMSTMLSIVARRTGGGWSVSYACASSPSCAPGADHRAVSYTLSPRDAAEVDSILKRLATGPEPDGQPPSPAIIGGQLLVSIDDHGFRHDYRRVISWGKTLGRLETLLSPPAA